MSDITCPYCGADEDINHDDGQGYDEGVLHQQECGTCGKTFTFWTYIHFSYTPARADCLNGSPHDYRESKFPPIGYQRLICKTCEDVRTTKIEEQKP